MKERIIRIFRSRQRQIRFAAITAGAALSAVLIISFTGKLSGISAPLTRIILVAAAAVIILNNIKTVTNNGKIYRYLARAVISLIALSVILIALLTAWYTLCFFPDDQKYLDKIARSVTVEKGPREVVDIDLMRSAGALSFSSPLTDSDRTLLLSPDRAAEDIYIDTDPYARHQSKNSLKYATGRIFYYIYQKKSVVIRGNSAVRFPVSRGARRFLSFDAVVPPISSYDGNFTVNIYHQAAKKTLLYSRTIKQEKKPSVRPFRYSNPLKSIMFYIQHPARSVLTDNTGWEKIRTPLPDERGAIEIEFIDPSGKNYLCAGSPKIFRSEPTGKKGRLRIAYLLFDTLSKQHIDIYEYPKLFSSQSPDDAVRSLGPLRALTPNIDRYAKQSALFTRMYAVGQVTRPSIVPLWTSKPYAIERMPVFRNIVSKDNRDEFYAMDLPSVPDTLSRNGYFTKQISCNAQGHGVSGVGVDLGFDENYDYTLEASEHTENIRRIIEFLQENQNRDFLLYAHINVPHLPHWVPLNYYLSALWDTDFNSHLAVRRANIRYLDDCFGKIMKAFHRLGLDDDTAVIITADHTSSASPFLRGKKSGAVSSKPIIRESQRIASFHPRAVYSREGVVNLYDTTMNVPWMMILPTREKMKPGFINAVVSKLDVGPTFVDMASAKTDVRFDGRSFRKLLYDTEERNSVLSKRIPLIGRFQNGILIDGRYKYWQNIAGLYKFRIGEDGKKYIMRQEYLFDLKNDPHETENLALDMRDPRLLDSARGEFAKSYADYPDKNFLQFTPDTNGNPMEYRVIISTSGRIIYPKTYGEGIAFAPRVGSSAILTARVSGKTLFASFETDPPDAPLSLTLTRDGKMIPGTEIYSSVEDVNVFGNPVVLFNAADRYVARIPARTGLEEIRHPGAVSFCRIPLIYWLELNTSEQDIKLSPGIKEVLRGWGYIQ